MTTTKTPTTASINYDTDYAPLGAEYEFVQRIKKVVKKCVENLKVKSRINSKIQHLKNLNKDENQFIISIYVDRLIEEARMDDNNCFYMKNCGMQWMAHWDNINDCSTYEHRQQYKKYILDDFDDLFDMIVADTTINYFFKENDKKAYYR
jgi:hypothetical protein